MKITDELSVSEEDGGIVLCVGNEVLHVHAYLTEAEARVLARWLNSPGHRDDPLLWGDGSAPPEGVIDAT